MSATPYADAAFTYQGKGWSALPLPPKRKASPPTGWTGYLAPHASGADVQAWLDVGHIAANVGLRTPETVLGIDVDAYGGKPGLQTMLDAIERLGPLPKSPRSSSRHDDPVSGIRFYRVPASRRWADKWPGVEFIHYGHRYAVAWPSVHPEGREYRWYAPGGQELTEPPAVDELPALPAAWVEDLDRDDRHTITSVNEAEDYTGLPFAELPTHERASISLWVAGAVEKITADLKESAAWPEGYLHKRDELDDGRGWEKFQADAAYRLARLARASWNDLTVAEARQAFLAAAPTGGGWTRLDVEKKWDAQHDRGTPAAYPATLRAETDFMASLSPAGLHDPGGDVTRVPAENPSGPSQSNADAVRRRFPRLDLSALLEADRPERQWVIDGLIPAGASVALVAPAGTGKSLLLLASMIAVARGDRTFAGLPLTRRRVLLVDMENTEDDLADRLKALGITPETASDLEQLITIHLPPLAPLDTSMGALELSAILDAYDVEAGDVVVLDSLQRVINGAENDSDTMRAYYRHTAVMLKRRGLTVIRTDNTGKDADKGARGTSGKRDDVDVELILTVDADKPGRLHLKPGKTRLPGIESVIINRDIDDDGRLTYTTAGDPFRTLVADAHLILEQLQIPVEDGERKALEAIKNADKKVVRAALRVAIKERRNPLLTAPSTLGAPVGAPESTDRAEDSRRTNGAPAEMGQPEREDRAEEPRRTPRADEADAHHGGAPPFPFSKERRTGALSSEKPCPDCSAPIPRQHVRCLECGRKHLVGLYTEINGEAS